MTASNGKVSCMECQDYSRASLAKEIHGVLTSRDQWAPSIKDFHDKRQTSDIIGAVASSLDGLVEEVMLLRKMLAEKDASKP